ncbi:hypothetical protein CR513_42216, partial [Mucuna pruriens]
MNAIIQDLKMQIGQLANTVSHLQSQLTLTNNSKSERECKFNYSENWKRIATTSTTELPRSTDADFKLDADSWVPQQNKTVPLSFPTRTLLERKLESDEELLRMFQKVEINIPILDAIKQIPKYAKFLKELCVHKRKKMKRGVEVGGIVSALTRNEDFTTRAQALLEKCRDPRIFSVPCNIGDCTFANVMLDLRASINLMPTSMYKSLNLDVLVQVNELIFPTDFYVLDMENETSGKGSTLILGRPFLMTARTKIDVHAGTLSMEFGFNISEAMKQDHSLFGIDLIDELLENQVDEPDPKATNDNPSSMPPPIELKPLPSHLKYAYLNTEQQFPIIISNNLYQEQEDKLLCILRQHKKPIGVETIQPSRDKPLHLHA